MAWGYWSAHALPANTRIGRASSPVPILRSHSRDQSLERDRREREQSAFPTPARSALCSSSASVSTAHHHRIGNSSPETDLDYRTRSERGTLPRGKSIEGVNWVPERNTLPRGKSSECDSSWGDRALVRGKSDNDWGDTRVSSRNAKSGSEGEWCPACSSGSRVSFQSDKRSREGSSGAEVSKDSNLLSSSLPTPPPPPFQVIINQKR